MIIKLIFIQYIVLFTLFLSSTVSPANAYERGEVVYLCNKNQKFLWVIGKDQWTACPVRVLSRSGRSHKVLAHSRSCMLPGFGTGLVNRGRESWVEARHLWPTRSSCERRGKSSQKRKSRTQKSTKFKIASKCDFPFKGFVHYKSLSGNWVNSAWSSVPNDGKTYNFRGVETRNRILYYYFERTGGPFKGLGIDFSTNPITQMKDGKKYKLHKWTGKSLPVSVRFCF